MVVVEAPRVERREGTRVLGLGVPRPRVSWRVRSGAPGWHQTGYEIEVARAGGTSRFAVTSADSVFVAWPAEPLESREVVTVRVRVTGPEDSEWSPRTLVEAGTLDRSHWCAEAIRPSPALAWGDERVSLLRREFSVEEAPDRALLRVTAQGLFAIELNGARVGADTLTPGWTSYDRRLQVFTYDVTDLVVEGPNALGAWLADGWYRGRIGFEGGTRGLYGDQPALFAQLELSNGADGSRVVATDGSWLSHASPVTRASLYDGEDRDGRLALPGWSSPGFDDEGWNPVEVAAFDPGILVSPDGPPVRCTEERRPESTTMRDDGRLILDFGQNLVGRLRLRAGDLPEGAELVLRHAEVLEGGELCTRPLREALATDRYVSAGGPLDWEPEFTLHGFRFAEITGWTGRREDLDVVARVYHSDMARTGRFECSDPLLTRLHENVVWSMRGNFVGIPTDCPQRDERLGWTGDIQVFGPTAAGIYRVDGFLASWLKDLAVEQRPDGTVPWYVPSVPGNAFWTPPRPSAVWGDAAVIVPWTLFQRYGDRGVLADQYGSAMAWADLMDRQAGPEHIWRGGQQLGDWLDPEAPPEAPDRARADRYLVATAYFAKSAAIVACFARELGKTEDEERYSELAGHVREAFRSEFVRADGRLTNVSQTGYALALDFGLFDEDEEGAAGRRLRALVEENGFHIGTGFAGTPAITAALSRAGQTATAYRLLLERTCPSWLYTVLSGGTTIWERWDSLLPDGRVNPGDMTSFNHYALGSVAAWMHSTIAGLSPLEPGYRRFRVAPQPGGGLSWANYTLDSPYGMICCAWEHRDGGLRVDVTVPPNSSAVLEFPGGRKVELDPGEHRVEE